MWVSIPPTVMNRRIKGITKWKRRDASTTLMRLVWAGRGDTSTVTTKLFLKLLLKQAVSTYNSTNNDKLTNN